MSDVKSIDSVEEELGAPAIRLTPSEDDVQTQGWADDIAHEYRLYFSEKAAGGCILYARYDRGWVVNPGTRWVMAEMARRLIAAASE